VSYGSNHQKSSNYWIGREVERRLCRLLKNLGWDAILSPGSRGPADISARKRKDRWCIQVKFRGNIDGAFMEREEWKRLVNHSKSSKCLPVISTVFKVPGNLMMNSNYFRDKKNPNIIRDSFGVFIGADLNDGYLAFFHNLLDGTRVVP